MLWVYTVKGLSNSFKMTPSLNVIAKTVLFIRPHAKSGISNMCTESVIPVHRF